MSDEEIISDDRAELAISLFAHFLGNYSQYLSTKRMRKLRNKRRLLRCLENRPRSYCCLGYDSEIFKGVISNDSECIRKHLRITPQGLQKLINLMPEKCHGWSSRFEIVVFLYWLACGASYRVTGASFNISRYTARDIVHRNLDFFLKLVPRVIKYPSRDEFDSIGHGFNRRARTTIFSNAVGAIDGTHVKISVPVKLRDQYINRKLDYTIPP